MDRLNRVYLFITIAIIALALTGLAIYHMSRSSRIKIFVSTTTSLYQTGLLEYLAMNFKRYYPDVDIVFLAIGSGEALERASRGDTCIALVHAPSLEIRYLDSGALYRHTIFAYNYFIIVGPRGDPANVSRASDAIDAFRRIYNAAEKGLTVFISRGDRSGTNAKEIQLWGMAGLNPFGRRWYKECGCGMVQALIQASEMDGYTLSDISTFLVLRYNGSIQNLEILFYNDTQLINIYSAYLSSRCSGRELEYAEKFIEFIAGNEGQKLISSYGIERYGVPLFSSVAGRDQQLLDIWSQLAREQQYT